MNLLRTLWGWLTSLFAEAPVPAIEEQECCEEECQPEEQTLPELITEDIEEPSESVEETPSPATITTTSGEVLRNILLSEGVNDYVITKYDIVEAFAKWYDGPPDVVSVRASIQDFRSAHGGSISAKLSKIQ